MALDMDMLSELDHDIEELKKSYEQYFQGTARIPPERDFSRIQSTLRRYREERLVVNTSIKFRMATLVSKFQTYSRYWSRVMVEISEGRYFRDRFKANLHSTARKEKEDATGKDAAAPAAAEHHSLEDDKIAQLHKEYMIARLECNQTVEGLSKEQLRQSIQKSLPALKKNYPDKKIEFKVVIENGKAKLKAVPK